ncbi:hypothetical protein [Herbidospora sp. NBRC 101105]|uniref:hypothetical protein n=1 Tax=Herbidospora sp. NBRC 101105 TaxID=3032195 RepID=UPI0024A02074|nr:hypothetical protein [Herbidospora sp. NBRC 101105]GLX96619.1 hypothetical protein Hesp01_45690 [Herbidospora sp. NBRC 101105]
MSFDLAFWHASEDTDAAQAAEIYRGLIEEKSGLVPDAPAVRTFHEQVISVYPDLTSESTDEDVENSPWMSELFTGPGFLIAAVSWSRSVEVASTLISLAKRNGLICYDPQANLVIKS